GQTGAEGVAPAWYFDRQRLASGGFHLGRLLPQSVFRRQADGSEFLRRVFQELLQHVIAAPVLVLDGVQRRQRVAEGAAGDGVGLFSGEVVDAALGPPPCLAAARRAARANAQAPAPLCERPLNKSVTAPPRPARPAAGPTSAAGRGRPPPPR